MAKSQSIQLQNKPSVYKTQKCTTAELLRGPWTYQSDKSMRGRVIKMYTAPFHSTEDNYELSLTQLLKFTIQWHTHSLAMIYQSLVQSKPSTRMAHFSSFQYEPMKVSFGLLYQLGFCAKWHSERSHKYRVPIQSLIYASSPWRTSKKAYISMLAEGNES